MNERAILSRVFSFPVLLGVLLAAGVFASVSLNLRYAKTSPAKNSLNFFLEGDSWLHIELGDHILATHSWPTTDSYSFTARGDEIIAYEWLGDVMMAEAAHVGGEQALLLLQLVLAATLLVLIYYYAAFCTGNVRAAFVVSVVALPVVAGSHLRPQLLGYNFLVIALIALERFRQGKRKMLWILPAVFLVWVNTHATFVFGLLALALYWASGLTSFRVGGLEAKRWTDRERLQLEVVGLLSAVAMTLTPYGTRLAASPLEIIFHSSLGMSKITEYQPISAYGPLLKPFVVILLLFILAQLLFWPAYRVEQIVMLLFAVYLAAAHVRFLILFAVVVAPLLAAILARWLPKYKATEERWVLNGSLMALITVGLIVIFPSRQSIRKTTAAAFPEGAVKYLTLHPGTGPLLNQYAWGGYLIWATGGGHKVFIDGRSQLYEVNGVLADYFRIMDLHRNALQLLRKYGINACLIKRNAPLGTLLSSRPNWRLAYADPLSEIYVRNEVNELRLRVNPGRAN